MLCFSPRTFIFCNSELPEMEWVLAVSIALSYINEMNIRKMPVIIEEPSLFQSKAISILVVQNMLKKLLVADTNSSKASKYLGGEC